MHSIWRKLLTANYQSSVCSTKKYQCKASIAFLHDDVIILKHFPRYWPFVLGIHRWPMNSPHKGQSFYVFLSAPWINLWVNNREAGDLRRNRAHYDVIVMGRGIRLRHQKESVTPEKVPTSRHHHGSRKNLIRQMSPMSLSIQCTKVSIFLLLHYIICQFYALTRPCWWPKRTFRLPQTGSGHNSNLHSKNLAIANALWFSYWLISPILWG